MYVRHSHNVEGWRACIYDLKKTFIMETFSNHTTALFALQNSASLPNTQPSSPSHSRGWTLLGYSLNLFSIKSRTLSWSKGVLALSLLTLTLSSRVWGQCTTTSSTGSTLSITTSWQTISASSPNKYPFSAISGVTYYFSFCSADGGSSSIDSYLTLTNSSNSSQTYSDDVCSDDAKISWTCSSSGTYNIIPSKYQACGSSNFIGTLAYKADCIPSGDETSYGSGSWIGYVYNSSSAGSFTTYKGSVTESENFDRDCSTGSATGATSNLCSPNSDLFAIRYKMNKSYAAGIYTITVGADDGVRLSVDGGSTWLIDDWRDHGYRTTSASVSLSGSTNLVIEYYENSGGARCSFSISSGQPTTLQGFGTTKYTTCGGTFYDSGGSGSNYTNDESYTVTFYPATSGDKVRLTFSSFATESSYDGMMIYDGNSTSATLISSGLGVGINSTTCPSGSWRGSLSGSTLPKSAGGSNGVVTSSASDGSLTVVFKSDGGTLAAGWAAAVSCFTPCTNPTISYSGSPYVFCLNSAISNQTPTVTNSPTSFSISPALPAGLSFNASTGVISGTPTTFTAATNYTITANNGCSGTTSISIATGATTTDKGTVSPSTTQTICSGESIAFTGGGSPAVNLGSVQYYWYLGHDIDGVGTDWVDWQEIGTSASLPAYNPRSLQVFANSSKFLFVRRVVSSCGAQGNPNYENQDHYIEVNLTPKPTVATSTPASRCGTGTVALGATASAGATIDWYAAASGGTILTTGVPNPAQGTTSFTTPSISATTSYYAQARNTTLGCLSTARTEIIATVASAPTTYYSKSTGNLNDVATWGSNSDGTGCSPANFTADGITYIIQNNAAPTTSGVWAVSGAGSLVKVGNNSAAITFLAGDDLSFDCDLEITGNATLNLNTRNMTLSGDFIRSAPTAGFSQTASDDPAGSTVTFSGSSQNINVTSNNGTTPTDSDITFNHIVISGTSVKLFYYKTNDRKLNINNFTVNPDKVVTLYSNPQ